MLLVIDDERNLGGDIIVRNPAAARAVLNQMNFRGVNYLITELCIDFDLGFPETGDEIVRWAIENRCLPPRVQVVSMSPPGRKAIENILKDAGYEEKDGWWSIKC